MKNKNPRAKKERRQKREEQKKEEGPRKVQPQQYRTESTAAISQASKPAFRDAPGNATYSKALMNVQQIALNGADSIAMG